MSRYILFFKPYQVLCQFSGEGTTLSSGFNLPADVYPAGRLDKDSEGLMILSDDGPFIQRLTHPRFEKKKTYWAQVEGIPEQKSIEQFRKGLQIKDYRTKPCQAKLIQPDLEIPDRNPPIRYRKNIPTTWMEIALSEGKNRQVRRMTAAIGHPTLRLIRVGIGRIHWQNYHLVPGEWREITASEII
jgi:23S rRNA pseudouridine2457 synthase